MQSQLAATKIPLLKRPPQNEQEVLSVIVAGHAALGIEKIIRVQTRFPDMLAKIDGRKVHLELEFDSTSFAEHLNDLRPIAGHRGCERRD